MSIQSPTGFWITDPNNPEVQSGWRIEELWESSYHLPVEMLLVSELAIYLDEPQANWYEGDTPTARDFMEHARRIFQADLAYPIIFSAEGYLMDGWHRLAKAQMLGMDRIKAVRFAENPKPDFRRI